MPLGFAQSHLHVVDCRGAPDCRSHTPRTAEHGDNDGRDYYNDGHECQEPRTRGRVRTRRANEIGRVLEVLARTELWRKLLGVR